MSTALQRQSAPAAPVNCVEAVWRWAPTLMQELQRAGVPGELLIPATAAGLALIHAETTGTGNPVAVNPSSQAFGLTQQLPIYYEPLSNPQRHLAVFSKMFLHNMKKTGGYIPTALWAWGSGPAAVEAWTTSAPGSASEAEVLKKYYWIPAHLNEISDIFLRLAPQYGTCLAYWIAAGQPTEKRTVQVPTVELEIKGKRVTVPGGAYSVDVPLSTGQVAGVAAPWVGGYDGAHRWGSAVKMYENTPPDNGQLYNLAGGVGGTVRGLWARAKGAAFAGWSWIKAHPLPAAGGAAAVWWFGWRR